MPPALKRVESRVLAALARARDPRRRSSAPRISGRRSGRKLARTPAIEPFDVEGVANDARRPPASGARSGSRTPGDRESSRGSTRAPSSTSTSSCAAAFERLASGHTPLVARALGPAEALPRRGPRLPDEGLRRAGRIRRLQRREGELPTTDTASSTSTPRRRRCPDAMDVLRLAPAAVPAEGYPAVHRIPRVGRPRDRRSPALQRAAAAVARHGLQDGLLAAAAVPPLQRVPRADRRPADRREARRQVRASSRARSSSTASTRTSCSRPRCTASAFGETEMQQVSRPFLIRAAGAGLSADSADHGAALRARVHLGKPVHDRPGASWRDWGSRRGRSRRRARARGRTRGAAGTSPTKSFDGARKDLLPGPQPSRCCSRGGFPGWRSSKDDSGRETMAVAGPDSAPASASSRPLPLRAGQAPARRMLRDVQERTPPGRRATSTTSSC